MNHRWLRLPPAIGIMAMALGASLALIGVDRAGWISLAATAGRVLAGIDFNETLMHGMLGASSLQVRSLSTSTIYAKSAWQS